MKRSWLILLVLTIALVAATYLVGLNQETRRGAYFAGVNLSLLPTSLTGAVGQDVPVQIWLNSVGKIDFVQTRLCYDNKLSFDATRTSDLVSVNGDYFTNVELAAVSHDQNGYAECVDLAFSSNKAVTNLATGAKRVATVKLTVRNSGSGTLAMIASKSQVSGSNPNASSNDMSLSIDSAGQASYNFSGSNDSGPGSVAHFKMAYLGLLPNARCANNWNLQMVALGNGVTKAFSAVGAGSTQISNGKVIFEFTKVLSGFTQTNNVALFLRGPKHLQMKYGAQNQGGMYNKAGGELTLTGNANTSTTYDFSAYPLLTGDVNQDGVINGVDFSTIKAETLIHKQVAVGANLDGDLDGDCMATNNDVQLFKTSLQEKQGQLY
ncbi:hypothetical protein M1116_04410 [Patescibacteria group bacterium]|nr:hypothetical protein [Patescibacteria group bacterium]